MQIKICHLEIEKEDISEIISIIPEMYAYVEKGTVDISFYLSLKPKS